MNKVEQIKVEIERRLADNKKDIERAVHNHLEEYFEGYEDALSMLSDFINSLPKEPSKVWHDASEPPKEGVDILFEVDYIFYQSLYNARQGWFRPYYIEGSGGDDKIFLLSEVTRWAYIDELTKL